MNQPTKTESIKKFLEARTLTDLAEQYHYGMEVQVNVRQDGGVRYDGDYKGVQGTIWTDDTGQRWSAFRIPKDPGGENPHYTDYPIGFSLDDHAEAIGLTGWNWETRQSIYVAYDFDSLVNHQVGMTEAELAALKERATAVPWVTIRKSTSGKGLHLYVYLEPVTTQNHHEHAALAKAILDRMCYEVNFDFNTHVDTCGGNIWVWADKYEESGGEGFKLIKQGTKLDQIPVNWRDFIDVAARRRTRAVPQMIPGEQEGSFEEVCGRHIDVPLEDSHRAVMEGLNRIGALWWFDQERHMVVCHTADIKRLHAELGLRGVFETVATGKEHGLDQNCFMHALPGGAWVVRRHSKGTEEAETWEKDNSGWTRCYLNRLPDFMVAMSTTGGLEDEKSAFVFSDVKEAEKSVKSLGGELTIPQSLYGRDYTISQHKTDKTKIIVKIPKADIDKDVEGWFLKAKCWTKVVTVGTDTFSTATLTFDDMVRHLVGEGDSDAGWVFRAVDEHWIDEPIAHIRMALQSLGHSGTEVNQIMGSGVMNRWRLTNMPFKEEYPGNKIWNRGAVQFAIAPTIGKDDLVYPSWDNVFNHCGRELDYEIKQNDWCKANGIISGGDYLKLWVSSMIQEPEQPLPYLFFYGPQGSGKSIFHEALALLFTGGIMRADSALISQSGFNGELASAVLCVVEETDLRRDKSQAYNRIKDWTTGNMISIHPKGGTPYLAKNYSHWVQMSNDMESCPVFPGDTRITMIFVDMLKPDQYIAKKELLATLRSEAADFLGSLVTLTLPKTSDRFNVPVIVTKDKLIAQESNQNDLEAFLDENCHYTPGFGMPWKDFYDKFKDWLDPQMRHIWTKRRTGQLLPQKYPKGRYTKDGSQFWVGNIAFHHVPSDSLEGLEPCRVYEDKIVNLIGRAPC